jgi:hypothetical protein
MPRIIQTLNEKAFVRFNNWLASDDHHVNPVFIGEFNHPIAGHTEAFCKLYNPLEKGLINEIVGYLITYAIGLKQPEYAFLSILPKEKLNEIAKLEKSSTYKWIREKKSVICFCTSRLDGHSAAVHLKPPITEEAITGIADDVSKWNEYGASIALDENIAHVDRHFNNLLRLGKQSYALIDNGRLINEKSENWNLSMLNSKQLYNNRILQAIDLRKCDKPATDDIIAKSVLSAEMHTEKIKSIESEVTFWLNTLLPEIENDGFKKFLMDRTKDTPWLLKQRFNVI